MSSGAGLSRARSQDNEETAAEPGARDRILDAAFAAFKELGYAQTSTLEIATRARVSKRELYALFGNKQQMLVACISDRVKTRMRPPVERPALRDREELLAALVAFGSMLLREVSDPDVIAVFRLAIAEASRAPEVAQTLDVYGRKASCSALQGILELGQSAGLLRGGDPDRMSAQFMALLWEDLRINLMLGVAERPGPSEVRRRAREAADAFLLLHPPAPEA
jgi:AcrR family transcriptional regulator